MAYVQYVWSEQRASWLICNIKKKRYRERKKEIEKKKKKYYTHMTGSQFLTPVFIRTRTPTLINLAAVVSMEFSVLFNQPWPKTIIILLLFVNCAVVLSGVDNIIRLFIGIVCIYRWLGGGGLVSTGYCSFDNVDKYTDLILVWKDLFWKK